MKGANVVLEGLPHLFDEYFVGASLGDYVEKLTEIFGIPLSEKAIEEIKKPIDVQTTFFIPKTIFQEISKFHIGYFDEKNIPIPLERVQPIQPWKVAEAGTVDEFEGCLSKLVPELAGITSEELNEVLEESRDSE